MEANTEYRIIADWMGIQNLQFKSTFKFLWIWEFTVWRYVPNSYVAGCFKERQCPWLYLPFSTSHCFVGSSNIDSVKKFCKENPNIHEVLAKIKQHHTETFSTKYI